jgi:hypothetical protein
LERLKEDYLKSKIIQMPLVRWFLLFFFLRLDGSEGLGFMVRVMGYGLWVMGYGLWVMG